MPNNVANVLLINVDQWPASNLSMLGSKVMTPTLDSLAKIGTHFINAYSATPVCIPARREILCGVDSKTHGDRTFEITKELPEGIPTIADAFKEHGYQTFAFGKLHVYPQRSRAGFDDVYLMEEGRHYDGMKFDDYERFLMSNGLGGLEFGHCMCNNDYLVNPWHLEERFHPTNWITKQTCETILRRDPTKPAFWYVSYNHPHPPLTPPQSYLDLYQDITVDLPPIGTWAVDREQAPAFCKQYWDLYEHMQDPRLIEQAIRGYWALCTHIDYQIRMILGTLREEDLIENTVIAFIADHGEMLGVHGLWQKNVFYENSTKVPMIIAPAVGSDKLQRGIKDERLVQLRDVMPTLLDLAGVPIPSSVNGMSLAIDEEVKSRDYIYGELWEDVRTSRMIRKDDYKLIYTPVGNHFQLFNLATDPMELEDLSDTQEAQLVFKELQQLLIDSLYGEDVAWVERGSFIGDNTLTTTTNVLGAHDFLLQRGYR